MRHGTKIKLVFLCWVFSTLSVIAASPATNAAATSAKHCLWRVQGKNETLYLMGSAHVLKKENYPLPEVMQKAFDDSKIVAFETDIEALDDPKIAMSMMSKAQLPEGKTLATELSAQTYTETTNRLEKAGLPVFMFEKFSPAMVAMTLTLLEFQKLGFDPAYGLDKHFWPEAKKAGKEVVPLETVDYQIDLLTGFSKEEGEMLLKSTLKEIDKTKANFSDLMHAWETGDAAGLDKLLNEATEEAPAIFKRLVTDRNKNWLPKLVGFLDGGKDALIVVGAGHLVGKEGLVELLRSKGFKITQL